MPLFQAKDLTKTYDDGAKLIEVLTGINLSVSAGEMTAITGVSGSGKAVINRS